MFLMTLLWVCAVYADDCLLVQSDGPPDYHLTTVIRAACFDAGLTFEEQSTVPDDLDPYDVVVLHVHSFHPDWGFRVCEFVAAGGGLMTFGATPYFLGMPECIGATNYANSGGQARVLVEQPTLGLHLNDIIGSSNNASDPAYRCAAAALQDPVPGARRIVRWEPNSEGANCGKAIYGLTFRYGLGKHAFLVDAWQYGLVRGLLMWL